MTEHSDIERVQTELQQLLEKNDMGAIREYAAELHPSDIADLLEHLDDEQREGLLNELPTELAARTLAEMEEVGRPAELLARVGSYRAAAILENRCAPCHTLQYYEDGRPWYPFDDIVLTNALWQRDRTAAIRTKEGEILGGSFGRGRPWEFEYVSVADRVWDRITRHRNRHGSMPRLGPMLSDEQKVTIRAHMLNVWEQAEQ